jgi:predicted dehydrogenase
MFGAERLDAAVIAVPARLHVEVAIAAINAKSAVLVEKPLAPSAAEAGRVAAAAIRAGVVLMPGHIERFNPAVVELALRVRAGEIGRVLQVTARRMSKTRAGEHGSRLPPTDVNVVHDSAIHDIDTVRYVLGLEVSSVYAAAQTGIVTAGEDAIAATLHFAGTPTAPIAALEVSWLSPRRIRDITVIGEDGMFALDYAAQTLSLYRDADEPPVEIAVVRHDQLHAELRAFVAAVREGSPVPVTPEDGVMAVRVADAITQSARSGKLVRIAGAPT